MSTNRPYNNGNNTFPNGMPYPPNNGNTGMMGNRFPNNPGMPPNIQQGQRPNGPMPNGPMPNGPMPNGLNRPMPNGPMNGPGPNGPSRPTQGINAQQVRQAGNQTMRQPMSPNGPGSVPPNNMPNIGGTPVARPSVTPANQNLRPGAINPVQPMGQPGPMMGQPGPVPPMNNMPMPPQGGPINPPKGYGAKKSNFMGTLVTILIICLALGGTCLFFYNTQIKDKDKSKTDKKGNSGGTLAGPSEVVIYYKPSFEATNGVYVYYKTSATEEWNQTPGEQMEQSSDYADFPYKTTIKLNSESDIANLCFNDGTEESWDNGGRENSFYNVPAGTYCVTDQTFYVVSSSVLPKESLTSTSTKIYYNGFKSPNVHYALENDQWTPEPGVPLNATAESEVIASTLPFTYELDLTSATHGFAALCYNDGNGSWDNNNSTNYKYYPGVYIHYGTYSTHFVSFDSYKSGGDAAAAE